MGEAVVVIPTYKDSLTVTEKMSLEQVQRILGKYPICFMAPERLRFFLEAQNFMAEYFPDISMSSKLEYSKLLLTPEFYERFGGYEYMLLYQLDAFVFSDKLHYFCSLGYDYIGAPMHRTLWPGIAQIIGNGGLALRKIESCIRVTKLREKIYARTGQKEIFEKGEDTFFGYCGGIKSLHFFVPQARVAEQFAIEFNVGHSWDRISKEHMPFGCHGWSKSVYFNLWRPYIEPIVGKEKIEEAAKEVFANGAMDYYKDWIFPSIARYLVKRMMREGRRAEVHANLQAYFRQCKPVAIWGYGTVGKQCFELLSFAGISVYQVFDKSVSGYCADGKIPIIPPNEQVIQSRKFTIVVSTTKYYGEIARYLSGLGLKEREDFFPYQEMENHLVQSYYLPIWERYIEN